MTREQNIDWHVISAVVWSEHGASTTAMGMFLTDCLHDNVKLAGLWARVHFNWKFGFPTGRHAIRFNGRIYR